MGIYQSQWNGLNIFYLLFSKSDALLAIRNTILYNIGFIIFGNLLAFACGDRLVCAK